MSSISLEKFSWFVYWWVQGSQTLNISKVIRKRERQREKKIFHLLVHFPNVCNSWDWAKTKPEAWNSIWFFHMDCRGPSTWFIPSCPNRHISRQLNRKWNRLSLNQDCVMYNMLTSQAVTLPSVPSHRPPHTHTKFNKFKKIKIISHVVFLPQQYETRSQ